MGFSVTATHLILFIATITIATGIVGIVSETTDMLKLGMQKKSLSAMETIETDIKILHVDPSSYTLIYVLNSGSTIIDSNSIAVFLDDVWVDFTFGIVDRSTNIDNSLWDPEEVALLNTTAVSSGKHKVKVVVQKGISDEYLFNK